MSIFGWTFGGLEAEGGVLVMSLRSPFYRRLRSEVLDNVIEVVVLGLLAGKSHCAEPFQFVFEGFGDALPVDQWRGREEVG